MNSLHNYLVISNSSNKKPAVKTIRFHRGLYALSFARVLRFIKCAIKTFVNIEIINVARGIHFPASGHN